MHGLAEIIHLLHHFSDKILIFNSRKPSVCIQLGKKNPCLSAFFKGKKLSAAYLSSEKSPEC